MLWTAPRNPHPTVHNSAVLAPACHAMWTTVENQPTTHTVLTRENERFPQVHNPYYNNEKNNASS